MTLNYRRKILMIEDTAHFVEQERSVMEKLTGVEVLTASNGRDALSVVEAERPDIVFLDYNMAEMNGDECCRLIKGHRSASNTPVIMVIAGGNEQIYRNCWEAGCDAIILKPIDPSLLIATTLKFLSMTRSSARYNMDELKIRYGTDGQKNLCDYCINLSMGGLFLSTVNVLSIDTELAIEFVLPNQDLTITCLAQVVWTNGPMTSTSQHLPTGMGLRFVDLPPEDADAIREYLIDERLKPAGYGQAAGQSQ